MGAQLLACGSLPKRAYRRQCAHHRDRASITPCVTEHFRRVAEADLSYPVILGPGNRVMDGMHRVARALLESRMTIRARRFRELPEPDYRGCRPGALPY